MAASLVPLQSPTAGHEETVYAQRMLPEAPALLALFHAPNVEPSNTTLRRTLLAPRASCLRKMSAYNGGFRVPKDQAHLNAEAAARFVKKRLSFADQHGGQLVLEREFHERDAPIYCNQSVTYRLLPSTATAVEVEPLHPVETSGRSSSSSSVMQRLLHSRGGRQGSKQLKSWWSQPELLSLCVLSCSVVGYVALTYTRHVQTK